MRGHEAVEKPAKRRPQRAFIRLAAKRQTGSRKPAADRQRKRHITLSQEGDEARQDAGRHRHERPDRTDREPETEAYT